jgi:hypothetical protein
MPDNVVIGPYAVPRGTSQVYEDHPDGTTTTYYADGTARVTKTPTMADYRPSRNTYAMDILEHEKTEWNNQYPYDVITNVLHIEKECVGKMSGYIRDKLKIALAAHVAIVKATCDLAVKYLEEMEDSDE